MKNKKRMAMKRYARPLTEVCDMNTRYSYLIDYNEGIDTSQQLTNKHHWEDDMLNEGLDESSLNNTAPKLWDE